MPRSAHDPADAIGEPYRPDEVHPLIDWRAVNLEQNQRGVTTHGEDGESLAAFKELTLTPQHVLEDPDVEILPD